MRDTDQRKGRGSRGTTIEKGKQTGIHTKYEETGLETRSSRLRRRTGRGLEVMTEEDSEERGKTEINKTGIPNEKAKSHESGAEKENNQPRKPRLETGGLESLEINGQFADVNEEELTGDKGGDSDNSKDFDLDNTLKETYDEIAWEGKSEHINTEIFNNMAERTRPQLVNIQEECRRYLGGKGVG